MAAENKIWIGIGIIVLLLGGCGDGTCSDDTPLEGKWECTSTWSAEIDGKPVPCAAKSQGVCEDNVLSITTVVSIGDAQWAETTMATCHGSGEVLYGKRISTQTLPMNDAARQFEKEKLEGKSLADIAPLDYRVRVISRTDTQFTGINQEDHTIQCERVTRYIPTAWDRKDAHRLCKPMIAAYPNRAAPSCLALHMCANEAILSEGERDQLYAIIKAKPDCQGP
jgi:hypothetical protein